MPSEIGQVVAALRGSQIDRKSRKSNEKEEKRQKILQLLQALQQQANFERQLDVSEAGVENQSRSVQNQERLSRSQIANLDQQTQHDRAMSPGLQRQLGLTNKKISQDMLLAMRQADNEAKKLEIYEGLSETQKKLAEVQIAEGNARVEWFPKEAQEKINASIAAREASQASTRNVEQKTAFEAKSEEARLRRLDLENQDVVFKQVIALQAAKNDEERLNILKGMAPAQKEILNQQVAKGNFDASILPERWKQEQDRAASDLKTAESTRTASAASVEASKAQTTGTNVDSLLKLLDSGASPLPAGGLGPPGGGGGVSPALGGGGGGVPAGGPLSSGLPGGGSGSGIVGSGSRADKERRAASSALGLAESLKSFEESKLPLEDKIERTSTIDQLLERGINTRGRTPEQNSVLLQALTGAENAGTVAAGDAQGIQNASYAEILARINDPNVSPNEAAALFGARLGDSPQGYRPEGGSGFYPLNELPSSVAEGISPPGDNRSEGHPVGEPPRSLFGGFLESMRSSPPGMGPPRFGGDTSENGIARENPMLTREHTPEYQNLMELQRAAIDKVSQARIHPGYESLNPFLPPNEKDAGGPLTQQANEISSRVGERIQNLSNPGPAGPSPYGPVMERLQGEISQGLGLTPPAPPGGPEGTGAVINTLNQGGVRGGQAPLPVEAGRPHPTTGQYMSPKEPAPVPFGTVPTPQPDAPPAIPPTVSGGYGSPIGPPNMQGPEAPPSLGSNPNNLPTYPGGQTAQDIMASAARVAPSPPPAPVPVGPMQGPVPMTAEYLQSLLRQRNAAR